MTNFSLARLWPFVQQIYSFVSPPTPTATFPFVRSSSFFQNLPIWSITRFQYLILRFGSRNLAFTILVPKRPCLATNLLFDQEQNVTEAILNTQPEPSSPNRATKARRSTRVHRLIPLLTMKPTMKAKPWAI